MVRRRFLVKAHKNSHDFAKHFIKFMRIALFLSRTRRRRLPTLFTKYRRRRTWRTIRPGRYLVLANLLSYWVVEYNSMHTYERNLHFFANNLPFPLFIDYNRSFAAKHRDYAARDAFLNDNKLFSYFFVKRHFHAYTESIQPLNWKSLKTFSIESLYSSEYENELLYNTSAQPNPSLSVILNKDSIMPLVFYYDLELDVVMSPDLFVEYKSLCDFSESHDLFVQNSLSFIKEIYKLSTLLTLYCTSHPCLPVKIFA